ncbi:SCAN domain-containing protein 3-like [Phlebotomus papatasi]|uniref:SCAN domain-containing protein 3-like n=1 Tax=Phlebotomus papatasi TaxID=29031 RepID=UPI0024844B15|nr:SCAN domain-containing protein 3-like [Phlebotomus papatasi]
MLPKEASEFLSMELAKRNKPYTDAVVYIDIISSLLDKMGQTTAAKLLKEIPHSRATMTRHISRISENVREKLKQKLNRCDSVSICLDETTDITDESQLLMYVRGVILNGEAEAFEEMLQLQCLPTRTTGADIYKVVMATLQEFNLTEKLFRITTDGARSLCGHINGLNGRMLEIIPGLRHYHCILHQTALSAKFLSELPAPKKAFKIINGLRGGHNSLTHRSLKRYLEENKAPYKDLLMYTEVRWMSRGKALKRLFDLRKEITSFVHRKDVKISEELKKLTSSRKFWKEIAFFTDITGRLNDLNLSLQVFFIPPLFFEIIMVFR